ncbi:MAG TPA: hypothetical protein VGM39_00930 [Kofleriaceae bacterium]|jgi:hypothetical protein
MRYALLCLALLACRDKAAEDAAAPTVPVEPAVAQDAAVDAGASKQWPELADLPTVTPLRVITLPTRPDVPRFTVGGPAVLKDIAVVASSQLGFAAVDWRRGQIVWTKPAGSRLAPPLSRIDDVVLIGECLQAPTLNDTLLGCARIVTVAGADQAYFAIHGGADVTAFAGAMGPQDVWADGENSVRWRRGDKAVHVDLITGKATPAPAERPPLTILYSGRTIEIEQSEDGTIVGKEKGKPDWKTKRQYGELLGTVWLPQSAPMIRMVHLSSFDGEPELRLLDMDATGSMNGTASWTSLPALMMLGRAISPAGDTVLSIRLDNSIKRDYIAAYAASALLMYVFPLPEVLRPDPVGVAFALDPQGAPEAVIAFYDGDQIAVLPGVLAPPTAPGATRGTLENPTP